MSSDVKYKKKRIFGIKKLFVLVLAVCLATAITACGKTDKEKNGDADSSVKNTGSAGEDTVQNINCLTGQESQSEEIKRPVAVMISNAKINLPQSGLSDADIIYEAVTEGGITRLMALYSDIDKISRAGAIRSARDQFIELMLPLNAIYVHIGTSTSAARMLNFYSYKDIDGIYLGFLSFQYDTEMAKTKSSDHCWFTNSELIKAGIEKNEIPTKNSFYPAFNFVNPGEERPLSGKDVASVAFSYSSYADVALVWDSEKQKFVKYAFGVPHNDRETGETLAFDNVFLITTKVGVEEENGILPDFDFTGGDGYYFYGGKCMPITWKKGEPVEPLIFYDKNGEPIKVNTGKTYVGVLGLDRADTIDIKYAGENSRQN